MIKAGFKSCEVVEIFPSDTYLIVELLNIAPSLTKTGIFGVHIIKFLKDWYGPKL